MDKQVLFRDRQELQAVDLNNVEGFADRAFSHVIEDAITGERQIVGLTITQDTTTSIKIGIGRLWSGDTGEIFALDAEVATSIFSHLPVTDMKWLAVSVAGEEQETTQEPRDFLIDLQTNETEPQSVTMEKRRVAVTYITAGVESTDPQKPVAPTGHTLIGYVKLDASGILSIEQAENKELPNLHLVNQRVVQIENWRAVAEPQLASMATDIVDLAAQMRELEASQTTQGIIRDVSRLKDLSNLPDTYSAYGGDIFLTEDESDTVHVDYNSRVEEGIRFPFAGMTEQVLSLFNPLTTDVVSHSGFMLPAYNHVARLQTRGYAGELSISQYQSQSFEFKVGTISRNRIRYGPSFQYTLKMHEWKAGEYDPATNILKKDGESFIVSGYNPYYWGYVRNQKNYWGAQQITLTPIWTDVIQHPYWHVIPTTENISGAQIAQTFQQAQNGWLTKVRLYLTRAAASGVLYAHICETVNGVPDLTKTIGTASVAAAALNEYPDSTEVVFSEPVFLKTGGRYALVLTTTGDHYVAVVSGSKYTQGTLFYSLDAAYYQGDFTKDLMMDFYYAQFTNPRTVVELGPISLAGGISDVDLLADMVEPESTSFVLEYQKDGAGVWVPIDVENPQALTGLPGQLNLRAVFNGSIDLMPGIRFAGSRLRALQAGTSGVHVSTEITLAAASDDIKVTLLIQDWDAGHHTLTCALLDTGGPYASDSDSDVAEGDAIRRTFLFTPEDAVGITTFRVKVTYSTDDAAFPLHIAERFHWAIDA